MAKVKALNSLISKILADENTPVEKLSDKNKNQKTLKQIGLDLIEEFFEMTDEKDVEYKNGIIRLTDNLFKAELKSIGGIKDKNPKDISDLKKILAKFNKLKENYKNDANIEFNQVIKGNNQGLSNLLSIIANNAEKFDFDDIYNLLNVMPRYAEGETGFFATLRSFFDNDKNKRDEAAIKFMEVVINKAADQDEEKAVKTLELLWTKVNNQQEEGAIKLIQGLSSQFGTKEQNCNFTGLFDKVAKSGRVALEKVCMYVVDEEYKKIWLTTDAIKKLVENNINGDLGINDIHRIVQLCDYTDLENVDSEAAKKNKVGLVEDLLSKNWQLELKDKDGKKVKDIYKDKKSKDVYGYIKNNLPILLERNKKKKISSSAMKFMLKMSKNAKDVDKLSLSDILRMTSAYDGMIDPELSAMIFERIAELMKKKNEEPGSYVGFKGLEEILLEEGYFTGSEMENQKEQQMEHIFKNLCFKLGSVGLTPNSDNDKNIRKFLKWMASNYPEANMGRYDQVLPNIPGLRSDFENKRAKEFDPQDKLSDLSDNENVKRKKIKLVSNIFIEFTRMFGDYSRNNIENKEKNMFADKRQRLIDVDVFKSILQRGLISKDIEVRTNFDEIIEKINSQVAEKRLEVNASKLQEENCINEENQARFRQLMSTRTVQDIQASEKSAFIESEKQPKKGVFNDFKGTNTVTYCPILEVQQLLGAKFSQSTLSMLVRNAEDEFKRNEFIQKEAGVINYFLNGLKNYGKSLGQNGISGICSLFVYKLFDGKPSPYTDWLNVYLQANVALHFAQQEAELAKEAGHELNQNYENSRWKKRYGVLAGTLIGGTVGFGISFAVEAIASKLMITTITAATAMPYAIIICAAIAVIALLIIICRHNSKLNQKADKGKKVIYEVQNEPIQMKKDIKEGLMADFTDNSENISLGSVLKDLEKLTDETEFQLDENGNYKYHGQARELPYGVIDHNELGAPIPVILEQPMVQIPVKSVIPNPTEPDVNNINVLKGQNMAEIPVKPAFVMEENMTQMVSGMRKRSYFETNNGFSPNNKINFENVSQEQQNLVHA